jgi:diguanylate cyclase (GGDEF)-like protein
VLLDETQSSAQVPVYVQALAELLDLQGVIPDAESDTESDANLPVPASPRLLLIGNLPQLGAALKQIPQAAELGWQMSTTLEEGAMWLKTHTPELVIVEVDAANSVERALPLLAKLADRTPAIPSIVMIDRDALYDRVQIATAGVQGVLAKPVTAAALWETAHQILQRSRAQMVNLLAVDDDPMLLDALRPMLEPWGMRVTPLSDPARFWHVLNATHPDLLILDVEMPAFNGIELCQAVRTDPQWQDLPIVFLTAHRDAETVQQVFAAGADDYVSKPILGAELLTRITNRLERTHLLQTLSSRDSKTGLSNQPQSQRELEHLLQQAAIDRTPAALVLLTLVDAHALNVRYGHSAGNQVLKHWGDSLRATFRGDEVLGYWDYGEFVLGIPRLSQSDVRDRLSPLLTRLRKQIFTSATGDRFQVNYRIGIAEYPSQGQTVQSLYQAASQGG